jgi:hypothetical protein
MPPHFESYQRSVVVTTIKLSAAPRSYTHERCSNKDTALGRFEG